MATFLEGVESISLPCTLIILLPLVALLFAAKAHRLFTVIAYLTATSVMMWARAGRLWDIESTGAVTLVITAAIVGSFALVVTRAEIRPGRVALAGLLAGGIAGWLWEPCVGTQFGEILNNAETDRLSTLALMHIYVAGTLLPAVLFAVVPHAAPTTKRLLHHRHLRSVGVTLGLVYASTVAIGRYDDLVAELVRISST